MMPPDVTQADREAAAPIMRHLYSDEDGSDAPILFERDVENGKYDEQYIVQAFAAHRLAAIAEERARVVAWLRDEGSQARKLSHKEPVETQRMYHLGQHDGLLLASDAIERGDHIQEK